MTYRENETKEAYDSREKVSDDSSASRPKGNDGYLEEATQVPTQQLGMILYK